MSATTKIVRAAPVFAALGDETRLAIVARLSAGGPQSIVRLTEDAHVSRQAITKHLLALEGAGLVRSSRDGRERIWEIQAEAPGRREALPRTDFGSVGRRDRAPALGGRRRRTRDSAAAEEDTRRTLALRLQDRPAASTCLPALPVRSLGLM